MKTATGYYTSKELMKRFKVSNTTLWRWVNREANPMPKPRLTGAGSLNRWAFEDINEWENKQSV